MRCVHMAWWPLVVSGLVSWSMASPAQRDEPKARFDKVVLGSSGGFSGRGSGKGLTVEARGQFVTKSRDKQKNGDLKAEELEQLRKLVAAVEWKGIKASYMGRGADFFVDDLAVTIDGKTSETHVSEQVQRKDLPKGLGALLDYLDKLYESYKP